MPSPRPLPPHRGATVRAAAPAGTALLLVLLAPVLLALLAPGPAHADDARAREIMQRVNDRDDGDNRTSEVRMVLIDKNGNRRERELRSFVKDRDADTTMNLMFFAAPADVKGTGFLTYDYDGAGKDDDQWLYLPALQKTKRIASDDKSGSFMGSDFNYSDLSEPDLEDYEFTLMREVEVDGHPTWQIESVPRNEDVAEETGYAKSVVWVRQDNDVVIRALRWVHKSPRRKYMQVTDLKQIEGIWVATGMQMVTREGKRTVHATTLAFDNVRFGQELGESLFTVRQLEKGL